MRELQHKCFRKLRSEVRAMAAETSILHGAELYAASEPGVMHEAVQAQIVTARAVLGVRDKAEAAGVLTELGWTDVASKAMLARMMLWWKVPQSQSGLMRGMEQYAEAMVARHSSGTTSPYNWWAHTQRVIRWLAERAGCTMNDMRGMKKREFNRLAKRHLWRAEYVQRSVECVAHVRLYMIGHELRGLAERVDFRKRTRWPGAPYLGFVDDRYHVRMLAMTRLGLLPLEIETGRWKQTPREQRLCQFGCGCVGDTAHFLQHCRGLESACVEGVYSVDEYGRRRIVPPLTWKRTALQLASRFQERARRLKHTGRAAAGEDKEMLDMYVQMQRASGA